MHRALVAVFVVVAAINAGGCGESPRQRAEKQEAERRERDRAEQQQRAFITALAAPHGAVIIEERSFAWTADVQDTLMPEDGRAVAGIASLSDVEREEKSYIVRLVYGNYAPSLVLMLKCEPPAERPERSWSSDWMISITGPRYVFVAKIDSVRPRRALVSSETGPDVERVGWVAEGRCLALQKIPADESTAGSRQITDKVLREQK